MGRFIAKTIKGSVIEYDNGSFDEWCVYLVKENGERHAFRDIEYFNLLEQFGLIYGQEKVYNDFVDIYNNSSTSISDITINKISKLAKEYENNENKAFVLFVVLHATMVAEENKENTKLGKRIKRLGVHQVLIDNIKPKIASGFSRGMKWGEIDRICTEKGF